MNKIKIYIAALLALCFTACNEDFDDWANPQAYPQEEQQTVSGFTVALGSDFSAPVLMDNLNEGDTLQAVITTATPAMNEGAVVAHRLEVSADEGFATYVQLPGFSEEGTAYVLASDLAAATKQLYGAAAAPRQLHLRTNLYITEGTAAVLMPEPLTAGTVTVTLSPSAKPVLYLTGSLIDGVDGWKNSPEEIGKGLQLLFSDTGDMDGQYTYTGLFAANGEFKLPTQAGNWDTAYAYDTDANLLAPDNGGGNILGPVQAGYYTLDIDLNTLEIGFTHYTNGATAPTYPTIGVIGDATPGGWDSDTDMTEASPHIWVLEEITLAAGEVKFRANDDWSDNWGAAEATLPFGKGESNAGNIAVDEPGTYFIQFNDLTGHYVIILRNELN